MPDWEKVLTQEWVATARLGVITDVDGTISPIVDQPDAAQVTPRSKELLAALHKNLALVAVVSGRAAIDVRDRVGLPELVYVGNHGLERWTDGGVESPPEVKQYRSALEAARDALDEKKLGGMMVEDKTATLTVHYRNAPDPQDALERFRPVVRAVCTEHGLHMFEGRMIFEVRPPIHMNKGSAFESLVRDYDLDAALYLGDDVTDVDALRKARQLRDAGACAAYGIGVDAEDAPPAVIAHADVVVSGVSGVESLLAWLLKARRASSS